MITAQEEVLEVCAKLYSITEKAELATEKAANIEVVQKSAAQQQLFVPVVGHFSTGKSTMINTLIGDAILPTGITPETSLATEIHWTDGTPYAEGINEKGNAQRYEISQMKQLTADASSLRFARLYLNNSTIKEIQPLVLVDMPGFDAPLEHHNKAIAEYIGKGIYYIVLTKVSDGTITRTLLSRLQEIHNLGRKFSLFLTNSDVELPSKVTQVQTLCAEILHDNFGFVPNVEAINNTSSKSVLQCLKTIQIDDLFKDLYYSHVNEAAISVLEGLNYRIKSFELEASSIKQAQDELKRSIETLTNTSESEIQNMRNKYSASMINNIISDVSEDLDNSLDEIVSAVVAKNNVEPMLNEIVRSSLIRSIEQRVGEANESIAMDFSDSVGNLSELFKNMDIDTNYAKNIMNTMQEIFKSLPINTEGKNPDVFKNTGNLLGSARALELSTLLTSTTTTTISTAVGAAAVAINPILGGIIILLPTIFKGLMSLLGQKNNNDTIQSEIRAKIAGEVFPQIKSKLRNELPSILKQIVSGMIEQVRSQYQQILQSQQAEFNKAMMEKAESEQAISEKKDLFIGLRRDVQNTLQNISSWRLA
jgi:hypothetical protein